MTLIYLLALAGVGLALALTVADAVISVSRPAAWRRATPVSFVQGVDSDPRRTRQLPFVGTDRRHANEPAEAHAADVDTRRAA